MANYKVKNNPPFLFPLLRVFFPSADFDRTVITFGTRIYAKHPLSYHHRAHEEVHIKQQRNSRIVATLWWIRYIFSSRFRYEQELEAFKIQYRIMSRGDKKRHVSHIAKELSGELYKNLVSYDEAMQAVLECCEADPREY